MGSEWAKFVEEQQAALDAQNKQKAQKKQDKQEAPKAKASPVFQEPSAENMEPAELFLDWYNRSFGEMPKDFRRMLGTLILSVQDVRDEHRNRVGALEEIFAANLATFHRQNTQISYIMEFLEKVPGFKEFIDAKTNPATGANRDIKRGNITSGDSS